MSNEQLPHRLAHPVEVDVAAAGISAPTSCESSPTMGSHQQQQQLHHHSSSIIGSSALNATGGMSVVSDLMRVYESMTGAAPLALEQQPNSDNTAGFTDTSTLPLHYDHHPSSDVRWSYDTTSIPIPPIPENALAAFSATMTSVSEAAMVNQQLGHFGEADNSSSTPPPESLSSSGTSHHKLGTARSLRKRTAPKRQQPAEPPTDHDAASTTDTEQKQPQTTRSSRTTKRTKSSQSDGRWSKRFTWPDELHRDFVSAIFDVGLKHSTPSSIMEQMVLVHAQQPPVVTTERIKSHLQKYRMHRSKSKKEFMTSYLATLERLKQTGGDHHHHHAASGGGGGALPSAMMHSAMGGGQVAAHLTYSTITATNEPEEDEQQQQQQTIATNAASATNPFEKRAAAEPGQQLYSNSDSRSKQLSITAKATRPAIATSTIMTDQAAAAQNTLIIPCLTEEEKRSPLGSSMGYLMGLFFTLKQQLNAERERKAAAAALSVTDVYESFIHGHHNTTSTAAAYDVSGTGGKPAAAVSSAAATAVISATPSTTRSHLEASNMMKREMQMQMAFQNKMRALKQQELEKNTTSGIDGDDPGHGPTTSTGGSMQHQYDHASSSSIGEQQQQQLHDHGGGVPGKELYTVALSSNNGGPDQQQAPDSAFQQGAGEHPGGDGDDRARNRVLSLGAADDMWNTDIVDDQLFEFLMNN